MSIVLAIAALVASFVSLARLVSGPRAADRIVALELLFVAGLVFTMAAALRSGRPEFLDAGVAFAFIGCATTIGWSWFIERAPRHKRDVGREPRP
jgi:multisubunit Na+/H+ antiporter MnhF subunit